MKATQPRRPGAMTLRALEAQAAQVPGVAPTRKSLRDYMAGPRKAPPETTRLGEDKPPPG